MRSTSRPTTSSGLAERTGLPVWVGFSVRVTEDGRVVILYGESEAESSTERKILLADFAPGVLARGGTVAGIMHSDVEETEPGLTALKSVWDGPLLAYPQKRTFLRPALHFCFLTRSGLVQCFGLGSSPRGIVLLPPS